MSESSPFIESSDRSSNQIARQSNRFLNFLAALLIFVVIFLVITRRSDFFSQYISQYSYRQSVWSESNTTETVGDLTVTAFSTIPTVISSTTAPITIPATTTAALPVVKPADNAAPIAVPGSQFYVTASFGATCTTGGIGNKLYEYISLYGIARTLNRVPYANLSNDCFCKELKLMTSFFPQIGLVMEIKVVSSKLTTAVDFANAKCCSYYDVNELFKYNSSRFIALSADYLQSFKFFDKYRSEVIKLLTFTDEDIETTDKIAKNTFQNDTNHKICVHIRRGDFLKSLLHMHSTEDFTRASVLYVREKLLNAGVNTTVALLGDDRPWARALFANETWAHVPDNTTRTTTDYAFVARHCQTVILTASASTFGFWSAYLSSAENIYYNIDFAKSSQLSNEFNPNDVFPPTWKSLKYTSATKTITEIPRGLP